MRRDEVIERLTKHADAIRALGACSLYLYGSHARDEARPDSDVDLFFDRDPEKKLSMFDLIDMKVLTEEILETEVDIGTRSGLHPRLKPTIEQSSIRVF